ncbi:Uncharacterized protein Fot_51529 [Forsythia ovata]|uniref:Uncharacterized protein n=1 Tax=Forsythia ovata TaxID=205694 RepID=A0ABD1PVR0_9LAMI
MDEQHELEALMYDELEVLQFEGFRLSFYQESLLETLMYDELEALQFEGTTMTRCVCKWPTQQLLKNACWRKKTRMTPVEVMNGMVTMLMEKYNTNNEEQTMSKLGPMRKNSKSSTAPHDEPPPSTFQFMPTPSVVLSKTAVYNKSGPFIDNPRGSSVGKEKEMAATDIIKEDIVM